jgi:DinB family protein
MVMSVFNVVHAGDAILEQLVGYIGCLSDEQYSETSRIFQAGTAGKHIRHTLDHFRASITTASNEVIDYDHRERGVDVETNRDAAVTEIGQLRSLLTDLTEDQLNVEMTAQVMCSGDGQCAELGTTRAREIFFALHHAIHHNAILKAIAGEHGIELDECFGTAPSTINFESGLASS